MAKRKPFWRRLTATAGFFWFVSLLPAEAPPSGGIPSARWEADQAGSFPAWFGPVQSFATSQTTLWRASLRPPPGPARLAATFVFSESAHGVARLIWQGSGRTEVLCKNLFEGAASLHQRTILVDRQTLGGPGQLLVESTGEKPVLLRAEFSWLEPLVLAATGWTPPGLFLAPSGKIFPAEELEADANFSPADVSRDRVVDAILDPGPVPCFSHRPVRFLASMTLAPSHGRIQARVAGLKPGEEPEIWVNGFRLPAVAVEVPGLEDPGYQALAAAEGPSLAYGGWRTAVAIVPPGCLRAGENQIDWASPAGTSSMTLRNVRLQASYENPRGTSWSAPAAVSRPEPAIVDSGSISAPVLHRTAPPKLRLGLSSPAGGLELRPE